jgi:hypothetical protein
MIRYTLACDQGHNFESWFQNSAAYDKQAKRSLVSCPVCGSVKVEKAMMAPSLARNDSVAPEPPAPPVPAPAAATPPPKAQTNTQANVQAKAQVAMMSPVERELRQKLKELRDHITKNANYVGSRFPEEARKIHYGEIEHRSIYGEASPDEAEELQEEGIEFHPLPILPDDQN